MFVFSSSYMYSRRGLVKKVCSLEKKSHKHEECIGRLEHIGTMIFQTCMAPLTHPPTAPLMWYKTFLGQQSAIADTACWNVLCSCSPHNSQLDKKGKNVQEFFKSPTFRNWEHTFWSNFTKELSALKRKGNDIPHFTKLRYCKRDCVRLICLSTRVCYLLVELH